MARVAIVSYDVQTIFGKAGGVGAFTTRWANLLRQAGESVTIVMARIDWEPMRVDPNWRARYKGNEISLIELQAPPALPTRWPEVPTMRLAEIAAPVLQSFDIAYFQDWGNPAFHLLRERRYSSNRGPVCVTVLHGPSEWELSSNGKYPELPRDLHLSYQERYSARHSDFVVSPSRYMVNQLKSLDWEFPGEVEVLGLPMPEPADATQIISRLPRFGKLSISAVSRSGRAFGILFELFSILLKKLVISPKSYFWGRQPTSNCWTPHGRISVMPASNFHMKLRLTPKAPADFSGKSHGRRFVWFPPLPTIILIRWWRHRWSQGST